jgi:hypothetical protein
MSASSNLRPKLANYEVVKLQIPALILKGLFTCNENRQGSSFKEPRHLFQTAALAKRFRFPAILPVAPALARN